MSDKKIRRQLREFTTIYKETDAIYSEFAKQRGLSEGAFWLMYSIRESDDICTQKEIRSQWTMSKQTVNSALKGLEKSGYIALVSSETDKRSKYIMLTEKGIQFSRENIDIIFELEQNALRKMSGSERAAMLESNRKFQKLFQMETEQYLKSK